MHPARAGNPTSCSKIAGAGGAVAVAVARTIIAFHQDDSGDWVADLECGHGQHVRHNPPWQSREWVTREDGRREHIGVELQCAKCGADSQ